MSASVIKFQSIRGSNSYDDESELGFERSGNMTSDDSTDASGSSYQEGWIISYVDILTLLLTLFVILLAMSHFKPDTSSSHQFNSNLTESEKQSPQASQQSSNNMQASSTEPTWEVKKPEMHKEGQGRIQEPSASSTIIQQKVQAIPEESERQTEALNNEQKQASISNITDTETTIPTHMKPLQQSPHPITSNEYLNINAAKLFNDQIDIARILPVQSAFTETSDEIETPTLTEQNVHDPDVTLAKNYEKDMVSLPHEHSPLIRQIENSQLGKQIEISEVLDLVNLEISEHVLFAPGSVDLKPGGLELLQQLSVLINDTKLNISVEGHTDNVPINNTHFPSNWELSTARATMVTRHLIENGIAPYRIRAIGYADTHPRADNETIQGRERNRRVSIILHMPEADTQVDALATISH